MQIVVLKITSVQSRVKVYRNKKLLGYTPLTLRVRWKQRRKLQLGKKGFLDCSLRWKARRSKKLKIQLAEDIGVPTRITLPCRLASQ